MLKNVLQNEELLLRKRAAGGKGIEVQEILERNKNNKDFNINSKSSNGNTALHWACLKVMEISEGYSDDYSKTIYDIQKSVSKTRPISENNKSEAIKAQMDEYSQIIRLLIQHGADYLVENKQGKKAYDLFKNSVRDGDRSINKNSPGFSLIRSVLEAEYKKIGLTSGHEAELAISTNFYFIIDTLKIIEFFPKKKPKDMFSILSLACGYSFEILSLILYFQHHNKKFNYIGIDNDNHTIEENKTRYKSHKNIKFIHANASNFDELSVHIRPVSIDFGIMRNGDFTESNGRQSTFFQIVDQVFPIVIKPDYPLLMTFYSQYELAICFNKTEINNNFYKLRGGNSIICEGSRDKFFTSESDEIEDLPIYPDSYSIILNSNKTLSDQDQLSHSVQKLRM